jgi:hypothetical protein
MARESAQRTLKKLVGITFCYTTTHSYACFCLEFVSGSPRSSGRNLTTCRRPYTTLLLRFLLSGNVNGARQGAKAFRRLRISDEVCRLNSSEDESPPRCFDISSQTILWIAYSESPEARRLHRLYQTCASVDLPLSQSVELQRACEPGSSLVSILPRTHRLQVESGVAFNHERRPKDNSHLMWQHSTDTESTLPTFKVGCYATSKDFHPTLTRL